MTIRSTPRRVAATAGLVLATFPADTAVPRLQGPPSAWGGAVARLEASPLAARPETGTQGRDRGNERVDRSTRTLPLGPAGSLELRNVSGDIVVTGGATREVTLEIVRRVRARNDADASLGLQQVQVVVDQRGERASVDVTFPRERTPYQVSTAYTVSVPPGTRVTARSVSGNVVIRNVAGDVAVETVSGHVEIASAKQVSKARSVSGDVTLTTIDSTRPLSAGTISGRVSLTDVRASRISAEVVSGDIQAADASCDSAQLKSLSGSVDYSGRLSAGGRYEFNTHSGSVRVTVSGPVGFELQATTFSGRIRPEGLALQAMTMNRGSLRATIGDGSAVVVAQTFSGDVVITKK